MLCPYSKSVGFWWAKRHEEDLNAPAKQKLRENLHLGFKPSHYQPYKHPKHWGAFCTIGI